MVLRDEAAIAGTNVEKSGFRDWITCAIASTRSGGEQSQHDSSSVCFQVSRTHVYDEAGLKYYGHFYFLCHMTRLSMTSMSMNVNKE